MIYTKRRFGIKANFTISNIYLSISYNYNHYIDWRDISIFCFPQNIFTSEKGRRFNESKQVHRWCTYVPVSASFSRGMCASSLLMGWLHRQSDRFSSADADAAAAQHGAAFINSRLWNSLILSSISDYTARELFFLRMTELLIHLQVFSHRM